MPSLRECWEAVRLAQEQVAVYDWLEVQLRLLLEQQELQVDGQLVQNASVCRVLADIGDMKKMAAQSVEALSQAEVRIGPEGALEEIKDVKEQRAAGKPRSPQSSRKR